MIGSKTPYCYGRGLFSSGKQGAWSLSRRGHLARARKMADINVSSLEKEMASALEADRRYQRENDAKFRAIHQKVGTYEEFRYYRIK